MAMPCEAKCLRTRISGRDLQPVASEKTCGIGKPHPSSIACADKLYEFLCGKAIGSARETTAENVLNERELRSKFGMQIYNTKIVQDEFTVLDVYFAINIALCE
jgi:hypothetical protein